MGSDGGFGAYRQAKVQMKAWLFTGAREPLQLIERETPRPGPGEVLIEVRAAGLCHSDVGRMDGTLTPYLPKTPPLILGHEVAGVVAGLGPGVMDYRVGDRVVCSPGLDYCPGWSVDGGYATHCALRAESLLPLPDEVSFVQGATATDAGQTSHSALMDAGELKAGQSIGIIGLGGLGMTAARLAVLAGAKVYAAEPRREAWPVARAQGVVEVFDDVTGMAPLGLDMIADFAGFGETTAGAVQAVRRGGIVVQVGLGRTDALVPMYALVGKAVTLRGSAGGKRRDAAAVLGHMRTGDLTIAATTIGFDDIPEGLARLEQGGVVGRIVAALD